MTAVDHSGTPSHHLAYTSEFSPTLAFDSKVSRRETIEKRITTALNGEHVFLVDVVPNAQHRVRHMTTTSSDTRLATIVLAALAALVLLPLLFMGGGMMGYMGGGPMMGVQGGMWGDATPGWLFVVSTVMQLAFLAVVVGGVYLVYRALTRETEDDALAELRLAYARGDLDDDEYERRREVLERD